MAQRQGYLKTPATADFYGLGMMPVLFQWRTPEEQLSRARDIEAMTSSDFRERPFAASLMLPYMDELTHDPDRSPQVRRG